MYNWRKLTPEMRRETIRFRELRAMPLHSPPHSRTPGWNCYHLAAANYEHREIIGKDPARMARFTQRLCNTLHIHASHIFAWCVLPNHWHALVGTDKLKELMLEIGRLHGSSSHQWNKEENKQGRQCWHCCSDRRIRTDAHFYATRNYIHHNPVKHRYAEKWDQWPFSSANQYLQHVGRKKAAELWRNYPLHNMGKSWDV
jgi:putative transposase